MQKKLEQTVFSFRSLFIENHSWQTVWLRNLLSVPYKPKKQHKNHIFKIKKIQ